FWKEFGEVIGYCVSDTEVHGIRLTPLKNTDEVKYYLFSKNELHGRRSGISTLSMPIGLPLTKGSEFFGADPISVRNAELFSRVGTFIPVAVSNTSAQAESIVYVNRTYKKMTVKHVHFKTFMTEIINRTHIDHLSIDTEGAEDDIFPMIAIEDILLPYNIVICHMNVEIKKGAYEIKTSTHSNHDSKKYTTGIQQFEKKNTRELEVYYLYNEENTD
ncbi:hypothetical protein TELCIR_07187, partial [Teladorsagia circumcincta]